MTKASVSRIKILFLCASLGSLFLQSCAKYEPKPFSRPLGVSIKKKELSVAAHQISSSESKYYFNQDLTDKGYQIIHLSIKNHSNDPIVLDAHWIDLHLASLKAVGQKLHYNIPLQVTPWIIASIFMWPFLLVAAANGIGCNTVNQEITTDIESRSFGNNSIEVIRPHNQLNKFLFVSRENWRHSFATVLTNKRTGERITFDVVL